MKCHYSNMLFSCTFKMHKRIFFILIIGTFLMGCRDDNVVQQIGFTFPPMESPVVESNDSIADNEILFVCKIIDYDSNTPIQNAKVKIVGTDTSDNNGWTNEEGICGILLPIVPDRNEDIMMFVFEIQHEKAITQSLSVFINTESCKLLGINNPDQYYVAYAGTMNIGWNKLGSTLKCTIPLKMKK